MNRILLLLPLLLVVSIPTAFAQVVETQGENYDLVENFNVGEATWQSHPDRIMNGQWENYVLTNTNDKVIFNTNAVGSFIFDKNSCSYSIYENGYDGANVIPSVSAMASFQSSDGTWSNLPVNDEACTVTVSEYEDGVFLTSTKVITEDITEDVFITYTGTTENFYGNGTNNAFTLLQSSNGTNMGYYNGEVTITEGAVVDKFTQELRLDIRSGFKETFKVKHDGDEPLGITQTIHTGESITIGENTINIAELNGQSFDRQYIIDNRAEILQIADEFSYDFDTGIDSLSNINIIFDNDYKVNLDYANGLDGVPFIGYLEIDPTIVGLSTSHHESYYSQGTYGSCSSTFHAGNYGGNPQIAPYGNASCKVSAIEYDTSSIPSSPEAFSAEWQYTAVNHSGYHDGCTLVALAGAPSTTADSTTHSGIYSDPVIASGWDCDSTSGTIDVTTEVEANLANGSWYAGLRFDSMPNQAGNTEFTTYDLQITYGIDSPPSAPTGLSTVPSLPLETSWTATPTADNGGSPITGYKVYRSDSIFKQVELPNNSGSDSELTFTDNELLIHGVPVSDSSTNNIAVTVPSGFDTVTKPSFSSGSSFGVTINNGNEISHSGGSSWTSNMGRTSGGVATVGQGEFGLKITNANYQGGLQNAMCGFESVNGNFNYYTSGSKIDFGYYIAGGAGIQEQTNIAGSDYASFITDGAILNTISQGNGNMEPHTSGTTGGTGTATDVYEVRIDNNGVVKYYVNGVYHVTSGHTASGTYDLMFQSYGSNSRCHFEIGTDPITPEPTTGSIGNAIQNPELTYTDSNLPDNTDVLSVGGYVKLDTTPPALEDDFSSSSAWTQVGTDIEITGGQVVGTDVDGTEARVYAPVTLSDTKWLAEFDYITSKISTNSEHQPLAFTASSLTPRSSTTNIDHIGFDTYADPKTLRLNYRDGSTNGYGGSLTPVLDTQYYPRMIRDGATVTLNLFTDSARTTHASGSPITMTVPSSVTGLDYAQVTAWVGSGGSGASFVVDNLIVYDGITSMADIPEPANTKLLGLNDVTFNVGATTASVIKGQGAVLDDDISSYTTQAQADAVWTTSHATRYHADIANDNLNIAWNGAYSSPSNVYSLSTDCGLCYDLGVVSDSQWLLRYHTSTSALNYPPNWQVEFFWGLTDTPKMHDQAEDFIGMKWRANVHTGYTMNNGYHIVDVDGVSAWSQQGNRDATLTGASPLGSYSVEIMRMSPTSYKVSMWSGSTYSGTPTYTATGTTTATTDNLRYLQFMEYNWSGHGGSVSQTIDNIQFWDGTNTPTTATTVISATGLADNTSAPQHYTFTRDSSNGWEIYQNGASVATATSSETLGTNVGNNYSTKLSGSLDEFFINSDLLSSTEISGIVDRGETLTPLATTGASTTTYDDNTVTAGSTYYYSVRAENSVGLSDYITPFVSGLAGSAPQPPTSVATATNTPDSTPLDVTVSWSSPTDIGSGTLTGFEIYRDGTLVSTTGLVTSYTETVPSVGTYVYSLKAVSTHGTSTISATSSIDTPTAPPAPNAPTLAITNPNPSPLDIDISWTAQSDGGSSITSTEIFRTSSLSVAFTSVGTVTDLDFTDTVPNAGTWYYKTASTNLIGSSGQSGESSITTATVPASDSSVTLAISDPNASPRDITVSLVAPSSDGGSAVTGYNIYSSDDNTTFTSVATGVTADTTITVPTGGTWYFTSEAINNVGTATQGSSVSIATPTVPTASGVTLAIPSPDPSPLGIVATFTVPSSDGGSALTGYNLLSSSDDVTYDYVAQAVNGDQTITVGNAGTWYFKSQAINNVGNGTLSTAVSITTASAPVSDSSVTLSIDSPNPSPLDITISLVAPSGNGGSAVTGYNIYSSDDNVTFNSVASAVNGNQTVTVASAGTWYFTSEAINNAGTATQGSSVSIATPTVPTASSVALSIDNPDPSPLTVTASFISPSSDGGSIVTGFNLYSSPDDSVYTPIAEAVNGNQTVTVASDGTWYFKSEAINNVGNGTLSSAVSIATPTVPLSDASVTLTIPDPNGFPFDSTATFVAPSSDGGSAVTGYNLFYSDDDITYSQIATASNSVISQTLTGAGTHYFKVESINNIGTSAQSSAITITTATVPPAPTVPTSVVPNIDTAPYTVTVAWGLPATTGGSDLTGYNLYRQTGTGAFSLITTTTALSYIDTLPTAQNQPYTYKIHALNNVGESTAFASTTITTGGVPSAPVMSVTSGTTLLSWTAPSSDGTITGYKVYRDTVLLTTVTTLTHSDFTTISFGSSYDYTVLATSSFGDSALSNSVTTTPETEITGMIAQGITGTGAVIDWDEPAYYQGQVTSYNVYYQTPSITTGTPSTSAGTTTNTYSNFAPQLEYDTSYTFGVSINSPLGNSGISNLVTVTTSVDGSIVAFDPTTGGMSWFDIDSVNDQTVNVIEFQRLTQPITTNGTTTDVDTLQVAYPSWWDDMTCDVDYKFAQKTEQYVEGTDMTSQVMASDANKQVIGFSFQDIDNEVIEVECAPQQSQEDDEVKGKYIMTQQSLSTGLPNIPLVTQVNNFTTGEYGTDGDFGALDVIGLFVILISMVGFNRVSPIVGVIISASVIFALSFFGLIAIPTAIVGVIALITFLAWGITRNK